MNLHVTQKISMLAWLAVDSILARSTALPVEEGRSKRVRPLAADQAPADDGLWHGPAEDL